jgi:hypothetical protein
VVKRAPAGRRKGDIYTVKGSGPEGDHLVMVMRCDRCDHLLPIALGQQYRKLPCIRKQCGGRYMA